MSDIPKSKRAHSNLEAHHQALAVRRMISVELLSSFAYSEKKLEAAIKKQTAHIQGPEHKKDVAEAIRIGLTTISRSWWAAGFSDDTRMTRM